jgi:hypothetical protein
MRLFHLAIFCLTLAITLTAEAGGLKCGTTLMSGTLTATTSGSIIAVPSKPNLAFAVQSTYNSGTSATLDLKIQNCLTTSTSSCFDAGYAFDQCGTSTCYTDGGQVIDLVGSHALTYVRVVATLGGTNPNYTTAVYLCDGP